MILRLLLTAALTWAQSAPEVAVRKCFQIQVDFYEATKGRLPDPDEADLIVDLCMQQYNETLKQTKKGAQK